MGNLCAVFGLPILTLQLGRSLFCLVLSNHKRSRARVPGTDKLRSGQLQNRGLVRRPSFHPEMHRSFASLRMTRDGNETSFAQNATLLLICTCRKRRETLRLRSGQAPSTPLTAGHEASTGTAGLKPSCFEL